jgi:hypothetical protein
VIDDESLVKTRTNTCLSYTSALPSYSVTSQSKPTANLVAICDVTCIAKVLSIFVVSLYFPL